MSTTEKYPCSAEIMIDDEGSIIGCWTKGHYSLEAFRLSIIHNCGLDDLELKPEDVKHRLARFVPAAQEDLPAFWFAWTKKPIPAKGQAGWWRITLEDEQIKGAVGV